MADEVDEKNPHATALAALGAAKGGRARAKKLSAVQRSQIARNASESRWARVGHKPLPRATHDGTLNIGELELPCAVLEDGTRILSQRSFTAALGAPSGGHTYATRRNDGDAVFPVYLSSERLKPFIPEDLAASLFSPVEFVPRHGGRSALGIKADLIPAVCDVWLKARENGALTTKQLDIAKRAEILIRGLAHTGIIALVDEATGYQDMRARDALAKILQAFVTKELRKWVSTFPPDYYKELYRLRGWKYPELLKDQTKRPIEAARVTNDLIYDRLAPGVRQELHRLTPRDEKGRLKQKLFQRLTEDIGHPRLREHLAAVVALMKASDEWKQFTRTVDRVLPRYGENLPLLPLD